MIYISFSEPQREIKKDSWQKSLIIKVLKLFLPTANPDFDNILDNVVEWNLEFSDEKSIPNREVGLNSNGAVVVKMPFQENVGYWTDNNMTFEDFKKHFQVTEINKETFVERWDSMKPV